MIAAEEARYLVLNYENHNLTSAPEFYSWTTGYSAERLPFEALGDGKYSIQVKVKPSCSKVDFVIALDASGSDWIKDGGDHSIDFPLDQRVVTGSMREGKEPELALPYNKGYEVLPKENKVVFYYRDDEAYLNGTLAAMQVAVEVKGKEYAMSYNNATKRFESEKLALASGRTAYRYCVKSPEDTYVLDSFNANVENECSYFDYYKLNAGIQASVIRDSFNYNENNVVKLMVNQSESDSVKMQIAKATIDVTALGGKKDLAIEPELQAVTIAATTDTALGKKALPITVLDQFGNEYTTSVDVNVVARTKTGAADDFDWDEACVYFMVTDRFFDGNAFNNTASGVQTYGENEGLYHGGDFAGVTQKLDYLQQLGINTIWLTPIVENIPGVEVTGEGGNDVPYNSAYHGYWASDFTKLNPTLGTNEEFATMIAEAHKRGIKIMVDIVVNHAGYGTEESFAGMIRTSEQMMDDPQHSSLSGLPDFYTEDADVRAQLVKWQTEWIKNFDIDYYRVDTVKHVEGTTWAALKNSLTEVNPSFKMIGEYAGGGYASNGNTLGTGEMDADLDFDFNDQATSFVKGNIQNVESFMNKRNEALNNTYMTGQFLGSHDEVGFKQNLMDNGYTAEEADGAMLAAAALQITAKGIPVIYYGEEIGLTGENVYPYQTNRYDFDWSLIKDDNASYNHYKKMLAIRNQYTDIFARGSRKTLDANDAKGYDIFARSYGNQTLYVGINLKQKEQTVSVSVDKNGVYKDLYSGKEYKANNGSVSAAIPAAKNGGTVVLAYERANSTIGGSTGGGSSAGTSTKPETKPETKPDTTPEAKPVEPAVEIKTEVKPDGTVKETTTETAADGSKVETVKETVTNKAGSEVAKETVTKTDAQGNVSAIVETSSIKVTKDTKATVTVNKDGNGNVISADANVSEKVNGKTATITADIVAQIKEAAGQEELKLTVEVTNQKGKELFTVTTEVKNLSAGNKLFAVLRKAKGKTASLYAVENNLLLVNAKTYKVGKDGGLSFSADQKGDYELITKDEFNAISKKVLATVKLKKASATLKKGKTTKVSFGNQLDMNNVKSVKYASNNKKIAAVTKAGKIKAKKKGNAKITATVTLKNGKKKNVSMKVTVK